MALSMNSLKRVGAFGLTGLLLVVAGCKSTPDRTAAQVMSDRSTSYQVKKALARAPIFKYPDVNVTSLNGTVQLTGFVVTEAQRDEAAQIASRVKGVSQVINEIMIKPMPAGRATIRDTLGRETGRRLLDTNSPPPRLDRAPEQNQPAGTEPAPDK